MPMLVYSPQKRATAQELLDHYWLKMPANFEFTMNEKEYQRMMMIKQNNIKKNEKPEEEPTTIKQDVYESDDELNQGDDEDNAEFNTEDEYEQFSDDNEDYEQQFVIPNYNNSFAAYGQYVSLSSLDNPNPQFQHLK